MAEVLVTLGIIGVVAAMTLPSIIQSNNEKTNITALKKSYSVLQQAYLGLSAKYGSADNWEAVSYEDFRNLMGEELVFVKECDSKQKGCRPDNIIRIDGSVEPATLYSSAVLSDGTIIYFSYFDSSCKIFELNNVCGQIVVDVNGFRKPNHYGKDIFSFLVLKDKIIPRGLPEATGVCTFETYCLKVGHACAGWVILNENMDYLHCKDLGWNGKTKCK